MNTSIETQERFKRLVEAEERFGHLLVQGMTEQMIALIFHRPNTLLSFDDVHKLLHTCQRRERGTQSIPLQAIVGSVGRPRDFTNSNPLSQIAKSVI